MENIEWEKRKTNKWKNERLYKGKMENFEIIWFNQKLNWMLLNKWKNIS